MSAARHLLLYLYRLLSALRKPLGWPLRRLLRLCQWALLKLHFSSRSNPSVKQRKVERANDSDDRSDSTVTVCPSNVPTHLSLATSHDTLIISSPTPIRPQTTHLSPNDLSSRIIPNSQNLTYGGDMDDRIYNNLSAYDHLRGRSRAQSRASSRAPSSFRNSHMGAEESAMRSLRPPSLLIQSRSASPASNRSQLAYEFGTGTGETAFHHFDNYLNPAQCHSPASTRPRFPTRNPLATKLETRSMVDLHPRNYPAPNSRSPSRARSPLVHPVFRARSPPIVSRGNVNRERSRTPRADPSPAHLAANPRSSPEPMKEQSEIRPCMTIKRYERNVKIKTTCIQHVIPSLTTSFSHENLPRDWTPLAHPEGALYWVHKQRPIYTDAYLCDAEALDEINRFLEVIDQHIDESVGMPFDWELVLELSDDEESNERIWSYYFVDHSERALFWLHDFDTGILLNGLSEVVSKAHIHLEIQNYYWTHWEMFPHNREVPSETLKELMGILIHAGIDYSTSPGSTSVYTEEELTKLLRFVKSLEHVGGNYGYAACVTGRLMSFFWHSRFLNFYGQRCARLSRNQSVYDDEATKPRSMLLLLSAVLFFAPEVHLRGLEGIFIDWVTCNHMWTDFIGKLQKEWGEFALSATVILAANVSFLAIPSVDNGPDVRSPSQIASYLSVLASVGCIIIGLLLTRQYRNKKESTEDIDAFLNSHSGSNLGFEMLAVMYSLPYSLLMWSMITFLAAFVLEAIVRPTTLSSRVVVSIGWGVVGALILWCAIMGVESENPRRVIRLVFGWMDRVPWRRKEESVEEGRGASKSQNPWFFRVIPRRLSTRSTLVDPPVQLTVQPPEDEP